MRGPIKILNVSVWATIWGTGKFHYSLWKGIYIGDRPKASSINLQETYGGTFPSDPEVSSEKLPLSTFQCAVQERSGILLADALSRVTPLPMEEDGIQLPIIAVNLVTSHIQYNSNEL